MTRADIEELIPLIPEDAPYARRANHLDMPNVERVAHRVKLLGHALNDPRFGWSFVVGSVRSGTPLPLKATKHPTLARAYHCLQNGDLEDRAMLHAFAIDQPDSYSLKSIIQCAIADGSKKLEEIDGWLQLPVGTTRDYNDLYFNVADRRTEPAYLASVVWPEGRITELSDTYLTSEDRLHLMLRATLVNGLDSALQLAGVSNQGIMDGVSGTTKLEASIMTNANRIADWGGLNQGRHLAGLGHGKSVLVAVRGAGETSLDDDQLALHNINAVSPALEELRKHNSLKSTPPPNYRAESERIHADADFFLLNQKAAKEQARAKLLRN